AHPRQHLVDIAAVPQVRTLVGVQEAFLDHPVDHVDQRRVETVDIEEGAGLVADAELAPGQHFEDFLHGAEAAGQGDERIGELEHVHLARVHRVDDFQPGQSAVGDFPVGQLLRDHTGHFTIGLEHRVGHRTHQADIAAAVDKLQDLFGYAIAQCHRPFNVDRI